MSILLIGDCLEELKDIQDKSVDLIFCDLPYGQTSCKWDCIIDLDKLWIEFMRVKKLNTPIIMTCTTKFGVSLIQSAPKKCPFRYDLVWCKSASAGFLSAKKMPLRKHELIYFFYEKLPFYDLSSHKHKFIKQYQDKDMEKSLYGKMPKTGKDKESHSAQYDPPLPNSLIKEEKTQISKSMDKDLYGATNGGTIGAVHGANYDPPLPTSLVKDFTPNKNGNIYNCPDNQEFKGRNGTARYEPPLPNSLIKEDNSDMVMNENSVYGNIMTENNFNLGGHQKRYDPPLPTSLIKEDKNIGTIIKDTKLGTNTYDTEKRKKPIKRLSNDVVYEPPLPNSLLEIKSTRGKHSTEKPVSLMSWILKYYSKEGDVILDPTMGSGSMGVACKEMNRNFIGIEKDPEIYEVAVNRIEN